MYSILVWLASVLCLFFVSVDAKAPSYRFPGVYQNALNLPQGSIPIGFVDYNRDQYQDIIVTLTNGEVSVHLWDAKQFAYSGSVTIAPSGSAVQFTVVADWNRDGLPDVLLAFSPTDSQGTRKYSIALQRPDNQTVAPVGLPNFPQQSSLPISLNWFDDLSPKLLYVDAQRTYLWSYTNAPKDVTSSFRGGVVCQPSAKISAIFADFDGDCRPDLFVPCTDGSYQIWLSDLSSPTYTLKASAYLPDSLIDVRINTFDIDGDGSLDALTLKCATETDCALLLNFNNRINLCQSDYTTSTDCIKKNSLCQKDADFALAIGDEANPASHITIPLTMTTRIVPALASVHVADLDLDGYTDVVVNTGNGLLVYGNVACSASTCAAEAVQAGRRSLTLWSDFGLPSSAGQTIALVDIGDDGTNDIVLASSSTVPQAFLNFLRPDGLFLKMIGNDGQCFKSCGQTSTKGKPYGCHNFGGLFKFVINDIESFATTTKRIISHVYHHQMMSGDSSNKAVGLASSSSYIDGLFYGNAQGTISWSGIIPNSRLLAISQGTVAQWWLELYIEPGKYILWVGVTLLCGLLALASAIAGFYYKEVADDTKERRRERHALNFDAL